MLVLDIKGYMNKHGTETEDHLPARHPIFGGSLVSYSRNEALVLAFLESD